jgi:regulator of RNase E activity RraA
VIRDALEIDAMQIGVKALGTVPRRSEWAGRLHPRAMTPL